ncbi:MAG: SRPBCC family protein [Nannocystaceae bacterium]|nr:SRPBCC family protein [bacterium]
MSADVIEKVITLNAPIARVWAAIADAERFGVWFGARFEGPFELGKRVRGRAVPTEVDDELAKCQREVEGMPFVCEVETVDEPHVFALRWNPRHEHATDLDEHPTTLVTFRLEEVDGGTQLSIRESGFEQFALTDRTAIRDRNANGWDIQAQLITAYLAREA